MRGCDKLASKAFRIGSFQVGPARGRKSSPGEEAPLVGVGTGKPSDAHRKGNPGTSGLQLEMWGESELE